MSRLSLLLSLLLVCTNSYSADVWNAFLDERSSEVELLTIAKKACDTAIASYNKFFPKAPAGHTVYTPPALEDWLELLVTTWYLHIGLASYLDVAQSLYQEGLARDTAWGRVYKESGVKLAKYSEAMKKLGDKLLQIGKCQKFMLSLPVFFKSFLKPYCRIVPDFLAKSQTVLNAEKPGLAFPSPAILQSLKYRCTFLQKIHSLLVESCGLIMPQEYSNNFFSVFNLNIDQKLLDDMAALVEKIERYLARKDVLHVAVASKNEQKVAATWAAFRKFFKDKDCFVTGVGSSSTYPSLSFSEEKTYNGALSRADLLKIQDNLAVYDYFVGIQNGVSFFGDGLDCPAQVFAWAVVLSAKNSLVGKARSASFFLPDLLATSLKVGNGDLDTIGTSLLAKENNPRRSAFLESAKEDKEKSCEILSQLSYGAVGYKKITRDAVMMALYPHDHVQLFSQAACK